MLDGAIEVMMDLLGSNNCYGVSPKFESMFDCSKEYGVSFSASRNSKLSLRIGQSFTVNLDKWLQNSPTTSLYSFIGQVPFQKRLGRISFS